MDYTKPEGITRFAYFTQVLKHEVCSIAYCEGKEKVDSIFISLENKGNKFGVTIDSGLQVDQHGFVVSRHIDQMT